MNLNKFLQSHPSLIYAPDLKAICRPLFDMGIVYFSHAHIDKTGCMSGLGIVPEFFELYFKKGYFDYDIHQLKPGNIQEEFIIWDTIERINQSKALHEDFMSFNQGHTFSIIYHQENTKDCYHFATTLGNSKMNAEYLAKLDELKRFILYFKDKVSHHNALATGYDLKIPLSKVKGTYQTKTNLRETTGQESHTGLHNLKRIHFLGRDAYLTAREYECLHWIAAGKTMSEIAIILNMSERTVKAHFTHVKEKLHCQNLFQLGMLFSEIENI